MLALLFLLHYISQRHHGRRCRRLAKEVQGGRRVPSSRGYATAYAKVYRLLIAELCRYRRQDAESIEREAAEMLRVAATHHAHTLQLLNEAREYEDGTLECLANAAAIVAAFPNLAAEAGGPGSLHGRGSDAATAATYGAGAADAVNAPSSYLSRPAPLQDPYAVRVPRPFSSQHAPAWDPFAAPEPPTDSNYPGRRIPHSRAIEVLSVCTRGSQDPVNCELLTAIVAAYDR